MRLASNMSFHGLHSQPISLFPLSPQISVGSFVCSIPDSGSTLNHNYPNSAGCYLHSGGDGLVPGPYNVSVQQNSQYNNVNYYSGFAQASRSVLSTDATGTPYSFQLVRALTF